MSSNDVRPMMIYHSSCVFFCPYNVMISARDVSARQSATSESCRRWFGIQCTNVCANAKAPPDRIGAGRSVRFDVGSMLCAMITRSRAAVTKLQAARCRPRVPICQYATGCVLCTARRFGLAQAHLPHFFWCGRVWAARGQSTFFQCVRNHSIKDCIDIAWLMNMQLVIEGFNNATHARLIDKLVALCSQVQV